MLAKTVVDMLDTKTKVEELELKGSQKNLGQKVEPQDGKIMDPLAATLHMKKLAGKKDVNGEVNEAVSKGDEVGKN